MPETNLVQDRAAVAGALAEVQEAKAELKRAQSHASALVEAFERKYLDSALRPAPETASKGR